MKSTRARDFIPKLVKRFPEIDEKIIKKIVNAGCYYMMREAKNNNDIFLSSAANKVKFLVYHYNIPKKSETDNKK